MDLNGLRFEVQSLREKLLDRQVIACLQLAAKRVMRETHLAQAIHQVDTTWLMAGATGRSIALQTVLPAKGAGVWPQVLFQDANIPDQAYHILRYKEVWLSKSADATKTYQLDELIQRELNGMSMDQGASSTAFIPRAWSDSMGTLSIYPAFSAAVQGWDRLNFRVAITLDGDFDQAPLPIEAQDAVCHLAIGHALSISGEGQSPQLARDYTMRGLRNIADLQVKSKLGTSGSPGRARHQFDFR